MKIIRLNEVMEMTGLGRSSIYNFIARGIFPKSVSIGGRSVGWIDVEIEKWISDRIEERDRGEKS